MTIFFRYKAALRAALWHLLCSVLVALACAALVFGLWYPAPYDQLVGGRELFLLVVSVDVVCGPLLTMVVFNPAKPRSELVRDLSLIVLIQLGALAYGLNSVVEARPVFLSFEGNRFRVVTMPDIDREALAQAPEAFQELGFQGPRLIAARLAQATDSDFRESIQLSLEGRPPSFRPQRWVPFESEVAALQKEMVPLARLVAKHPDEADSIALAVQRSGMRSQEVAFLPLEARGRSDWVVLVSQRTGVPIGFLPLDGW